MRWKALHAGAVLLFFLSQRAAAIAPDNQLGINPTNNDGVVRILFNNNLPNGVGQFLGTGTIIDNQNVNGVAVRLDGRSRREVPRRCDLRRR